MAKPEFMDAVREMVKDYDPFPETIEYSRTVGVVTVGGPSDVGKDTVMSHARLPIVSGETSRAERPSDGDKYRFPFTTKAGRGQVLEDLRLGRYVQAYIHPTTGEFYASKPKDYTRDTVNLLDADPATSLEFMRGGTFQSTRGVYITAPLGTIHKRWDQGDLPATEKQQRMEEAKQSLTVATADEHREDFYFILNDMSIVFAANALRKYALEDIKDKHMNRVGRSAAKQILHGLAHL